MKRNYLITAAFFGFLGVIAGALGAHGFKKVLDMNQLDAYKTAVLYQMLHSLAVLTLPALPVSRKQKNLTAVLFLTGVLLFSGSIYLFTAGGVKPGIGGLVTPVGGMLMIAGWAVMVWSLIKSRA